MYPSAHPPTHATSRSRVAHSNRLVLLYLPITHSPTHPPTHHRWQGFSSEDFFGAQYDEEHRKGWRRRQGGKVGGWVVWVGTEAGVGGEGRWVGGWSFRLSLFLRSMSMHSPIHPVHLLYNSPLPSPPSPSKNGRHTACWASRLEEEKEEEEEEIEEVTTNS